jgi:hypothetical protein
MTSPSASTSLVRAPFDRSQAFGLPCDHVSAPDEPASTASRPASVTIASRPSVGRDGREYAGVSDKKRSGIFFRRGVDMRLTNPPFLQNCARVTHKSSRLRDEATGVNYGADVDAVAAGNEEVAFAKLFSSHQIQWAVQRRGRPVP